MKHLGAYLGGGLLTLAGLAASHTPTLLDRLWPLALIVGGLSLLRPKPRRSA